MAKFDVLPNELLLRILCPFCVHCNDVHQTPAAFSLIGTTLEERQGRRQEEDRVGYSPDRQVLYSMCLVSTRFRHVAQSVLYHTLLPGSAAFRWSRDNAWTRCLSTFLRTAVRRPDLAALVQIVVVGSAVVFGPHDVVLEEATRVLKEAAQARGFPLADFLRAFDPPEHLKQWGQFSINSHLLTMLLVYLPSLRWLVFPDGSNPYRIPEPALRVAGISSLPLQALDIVASTGKKALVWDDFLKMASALRTVNIASGGSHLVQTLAPELRGLRRLCLTNNWLRPTELASILSRCERLESFIFEAGALLRFLRLPSKPVS